MEDVTCSGDLTKLCNHKRKVLALAAFQSSTAGQESHNKMGKGQCKLVDLFLYLCGFKHCVCVCVCVCVCLCV